MNKLHAGFALLAAVLGLALIGCGGSGGYSAGGGETSAENAGSSAGGAYGSRSYGNEEASGEAEAAAPAGEAASVAVGTAAGAGKVLVDSAGLTLYYFVKDGKGSGVSKCEGACAGAWPPLTTSGEPEAAAGVDASLLGTIERPDGSTQVTYAGWPLYTFVQDSKPGEDNGTDSKAFGAPWYPLHPDGEKAGE